MKPAIEVLDIPREELDALLERARAALPEEDYRRLKAVVDGLEQLTALIADRETSIRDLRRLLFPFLSEKTRKVLERAGLTEAGEQAATDEPADKKEEAKKLGHGRNGVDAYAGAQRVEVTHATLRSGDLCPACAKGKVYIQAEAKHLVRISGQAPIGATVYELERLRCNLCGEIYTAEAPQGVGEEKYDETAAAMIAQLKYGNGVAFHRLESMEDNLGIPLPAPTQWEIVEEAAELLRPAYEELVREAAQGEVLHNDDTGMRILHLAREPSDERTGVFTSGVVSTAGGRRIALFFTGRQHAGENLADVLKRRKAQLPPPVQMCDALSRNTPKLATGVEILLANCLVHGRRQFVEVALSFPTECRYVLERLGEVYGNDAVARQQEMTPEDRLRFHQRHSRPIMDQLHGWMEAQLAQRKTEPNSGLGQAIRYYVAPLEGADPVSARSRRPVRQ